MQGVQVDRQVAIFMYCFLCAVVLITSSALAAGAALGSGSLIIGTEAAGLGVGTVPNCWTLALGFGFVT